MSWQTIIKENGLAVSEISLSDVLTVKRLDAEYFDPAYLASDTMLNTKPHSPISDYVSISDGNHLSISEYFTNESDGIPYFRGQDVNSIFIRSANPMKIPKEIYQKGWMKRSHFKPNDILLSIVGTVGSLSFMPDDLGEVSGSCKIAILRPKEASVAKIIMAFLLSKYGQYQLKRMTRGAVQTGIILEDIPSILVPKFSKAVASSVEKIISEALETEKTARTKYSEAEQQLLKEINLADYKPSDKNTSVRSLSECLADDRFDAEYWQPKYDEIESEVSAIPQKELDHIASIKKGIEPGSEAYSKDGKPFIRVSDFSIYGVEETEKKISEELYQELKENYRPRKNEVLFTKDGTIGITYVLNEDVDAIVSGAFLRLKPKEKIDSQYLALVINSFFCKAQIERMSGGAIIAHLKPDSVKRIKVPILPDIKQKEIAEKVSGAFKLRQEAKGLLEKAKRAVEIFIEQDEKQALAYLNK